MICPHCGAAIDDRSAFCTNCGQPVSAPDVPTTVLDASATQVQQVDETLVQSASQAIPQQIENSGEPLVPQASVVQPSSAPPADKTFVQSVPQAQSMPQAQPTMQQGYYQPAAQVGYPAQVPTQKKSPLPKIAAAILALVVGGYGVSRLLGGRNINTGSGSGHVIGTEAPIVAAGSIFDANNNPTFYAMTELSGSEFSDAVEGEGFKWQESNLWWTSRDQNNAVWVMGPDDYEYTHDDIQGLRAGSLGDATSFSCALDDRNYSSAKNALDSLAVNGVEDEYWADDETGIAIITNSEQRHYVALVTTDLDVGLYRFSLISPEGIEQGMLQDLAGTSGYTLEEVWEEITGKSIPSALVTQAPMNIEPTQTTVDTPSTENPTTTSFGHVTGTEAPSSSSAALLDSRGNPTFRAMCEVSGEEFIQAMEDDGFVWSDSDLWWTSHDSNDAVWVMGAHDHEYSYDEIKALAPEGAGSAIYYACAIDDRDYSSAQNALYSLANLGLSDEYWFDDETGMAVFENTSGRRYAVLITTDLDIGLYRLCVFTPEAVEQGVLAEVLGDDENNTSLDVIWEEYTGRPLAQG